MGLRSLEDSLKAPICQSCSAWAAGLNKRIAQKTPLSIRTLGSSRLPGFIRNKSGNTKPPANLGLTKDSEVKPAALSGALSGYLLRWPDRITSALKESLMPTDYGSGWVDLPWIRLVRL